MQKNIFENTFQYIIGSNFQKFNKIIKIININREISMQLYIKFFKFLCIGKEIIKPIEFPNKKNIIVRIYILLLNTIFYTDNISKYKSIINYLENQ